MYVIVGIVIVISWKPLHWEASGSMRTEWQTGKHKVTVAYGNFTKAPKNLSLLFTIA